MIFNKKFNFIYECSIILIFKEQRDVYLQKIIQATTNSLHESTKAMGEEMLKQAKDFKMEDIHV